MAFTSCVRCGNNTHKDAIFKCYKGHFFCDKCFDGDSSFISGVSCKCGSSAEKLGLIENVFEKQKEIDSQREIKYIEKEYIPTSNNSNGTNSSSTGGVIYLGLGLAFLAWLYFTNKSGIPPSPLSTQSITTKSPDITNKSEGISINIDQIKSDLIGTEIMNLDEIKSFTILDSIKTDHDIQYIVALKFQKQGDPLFLYENNVAIHYYPLNGRWVFHNKFDLSETKIFIVKDFVGIIGDKNIEIHLDSGSHNSLGQLLYVENLKLQRQIANNSIFSYDSIQLNVISGEYSMLTSTLYYNQDENKYRGIAKYHDDALDTVILWVKE
jgi:uncharacterized protein YqfB (UPF0267 family)